MIKNLNIDIRTIVPKFLPILQNKRKYKVLKGGRASGKTWFIPQFFILLYYRESGRNAMFLRRYQNKARDSVFMAMKKALIDWDLLGENKEGKVECNISRMEFKFPNGNTIRCRGLDDPDGAKSSSFERGVLSDVWFEEADQISEETMNTVVFTIRCENPNVFLTFNPVSKNTWIYKRFFTKKYDNVYINSSCYLDNPFIPEDFKEEAERLKEEDPELFDLVFMGNWGTLHDTIYTKVLVEDIPLEDSYYDKILYGLDFGFNDPMAWVKVGIKDGNFYIMDEIYKNRISADELCKLLEEHEMPKGTDIESDHDKERQIILNRHGFSAVNADKSGKKSDRIKMIKNYKIFIHPKCENFIFEINLYKWKKSKITGEYTDEPVEIYDHLLDAFSYAVIRWVKAKQLGAANKIGINKKRVNNPISKGRRGR
jgi:phage terminase large subunit